MNAGINKPENHNHGRMEEKKEGTKVKSVYDE